MWKVFYAMPWGPCSQALWAQMYSQDLPLEIMMTVSLCIVPHAS